MVNTRRSEQQVAEGDLLSLGQPSASQVHDEIPVDDVTKKAKKKHKDKKKKKKKKKKDTVATIE